MWQDVLGAIFSSGSQLSRQNRLDRQDEEERRLKMERERQLIDLALRDQTLQEDSSRRDIADRLIQNIGPMGMVDDQAAEAIRSGGLGSRLKTQEGTLSSTQFLPGPGGDPRMSESPGLQAGTVLAPTKAEQFALDQADVQKKALDRQNALREHLERNPEALFAKGPMSAAVIWEQAGFKGDPPADMSQVKEKMDYEHQLRMREIGAQTAGQLRVAQTRADASTNRPMTMGQEFNASRSLRNDFVRETKAAREMIFQSDQMAAGMDAARKGNLAQGSQAVLVTFQKILDPTSVVRESEYARSTSGQSIANQAQGIVDRLKDGGQGVTLPELEKYAQLAKVFADNQVKMAGHTRAQIDRFAKSYGLDPTLITRELDPEEGGEQTGGGTTMSDVPVERDPVTGKLRVKQ